MPTTESRSSTADVPTGIAVCHLELSQGSLDLERILGVLRVRRYSVERLVLRGHDCHVWVRARVDEVHLLHSRLERLVGVKVCNDLEWRNGE